MVKIKRFSSTAIIYIKILNIVVTSSRSAAVGNPCDPSPCGQNGECFTAASDPNDYFCKCQSGIVAKNCDSDAVIQIVSFSLISKTLLI